MLVNHLLSLYKRASSLFVYCIPCSVLVRHRMLLLFLFTAFRAVSWLGITARSSSGKVHTRKGHLPSLYKEVSSLCVYCIPCGVLVRHHAARSSRRQMARCTQGRCKVHGARGKGQVRRGARDRCKGARCEGARCKVYQRCKVQGARCEGARGRCTGHVHRGARCKGLRHTHSVQCAV